MLTDSWRSSKLWTGVGLVLIIIAIATAFVFNGNATFDQWSGFLQVAIPSIIVPLFGALGWDKKQKATVAMAKAQRSDNLPAAGGGWSPNQGMKIETYGSGQ